MSDEAAHEESVLEKKQKGVVREWRTPILLFFLTMISTLYVGRQMVSVPEGQEAAWYAGWVFAVPLLGILLAHEMGHYVAGRLHRVDISPPFFIPMPLVLLGTMGAVIRMRGKIETRNALLDIGAAGPLAGMVIALPVLAYGIATSDVVAISSIEGEYFIEGRSLLYLAMLEIFADIPAGHDIFLSPTALAGWAGLLVTQINLLPVMQLDGGHVAYALFGKRQDTYSRRIHFALPLVAALVSLVYVANAYAAGERGEALYGEAAAGMHWLIWAAVLMAMARFSGSAHPPTGPSPLSVGRKLVAIGTLILFVLLFMPSWIFVPNW